MLSRIQLSALLAAAALLWALALVIQGVAVSPAWFRPFSLVLAALVLLVTIVDRWAWRLRFLQPWLVHVPDLRGTWCAEIRSSNPKQDSLTGYMVIRQTLSSISLRLFTEESASEILASRVLKADDGTFSIAGVYRNTPRLSVRDRSPVHHGGLLLAVSGDPAASLYGQYWTDRSSQGEISLSHRNPKLAHSFEEASEGDPRRQTEHATEPQEETTT